MSDSFPWLSLDGDERIEWSGAPRLHVVLWLAVPALAIPVLLAVLWPTPLSALLGVLVWVAVSYLGYLYVTNIDYVVSSKYVYAKRGILGRAVTQIGVHNIQDTTLRQGIAGTYAGYGTVSFSTAGGEGTTLSFHYIDDPSTAKGILDKQITTIRTRDRTTTNDPAAGGVAELLSELRAIRKAAQGLEKTVEQRGREQ